MTDRRTTVVTGAGTGIGAAIASELAALGWPVAIGGRRIERLDQTASAIRDAGGEVFVHELDVADSDSCEAFVHATEDALGPIDVLVNNAATATPGWIQDVPADALRETVLTNLLGPILMARHAVASMRAREASGDIVFITSDAVRHPRPLITTYCATKAGVETLAQALSLELEGTGIRVSTVRVGPTLSEFGFGWPMDVLEKLMTVWPRFGLGRHNHVLDPKDIARAVVTAVTAPPGVHVDTIEVQPHAPAGEQTWAQALERPEGV